MQQKWLDWARRMINKILALTAFDIVTKQITRQKSADHKCFRIKNFTHEEILDFVNIWKSSSSKNGLENISLKVAENIQGKISPEFLAVDGTITFYRNNIRDLGGLVYIETKVQSDEQGLQNIFTLQDSNFLDGSFSIEEEDFFVPDILVSNAWKVLDGVGQIPNSAKNRLIEVLTLTDQVPLRKYTRFVVEALKSWIGVSSAVSDQLADEIIGSSLIYLDIFPDIYWRESKDEKRIKRKLSLNSNYAELVSGSADIDPKILSEKISLFQFKEKLGENIESPQNQKYRDLCTNFINTLDQQYRNQIPFYIFEQLFSPDVSGMLLGDRVHADIEAVDPLRLPELIELSVIAGLNSRVEEDARKFLDAESFEAIPLKDILSRTTRRLVEVLANPKAHQFFNPMLEIVESSELLLDGITETDGLSIQIKLGQKANLNNMALPLFNFLFGGTLISIQDSTNRDFLGLKFLVDPQLLDLLTPVDLMADIDNHGSEDSDGLFEVVWEPLPIVINLVNSDGDVVSSIGKREWFPAAEDLNYFGFFWLLLCAPESDFKSITSGIHLPNEKSLPDVLDDFVNRVLPLTQIAGDREDGSDQLVSDFLKIRKKFFSEVQLKGLRAEAINEYLDKCLPIFEQSRLELTPDGIRLKAVSQLMDLDCIHLEHKSKLMIPTHPIRLRWISRYFTECEKRLLAVLSKDQELSVVNPNFYLEWLGSSTPAQSPAIASSSTGDILFSAGQQAWYEEFVPRSYEIAGATLDTSSTKRISKQIITYLEAHPYKKDGLAILLVLPYTNKFPADLISSFKTGEWKDVVVNLTVIAPKIKWQDISKYFDQIYRENRMDVNQRFFPSYDLRFIDYVDDFDLSDSLGDQKFDLAIITHLLNEKVTVQPKTEAPNGFGGKFHPLLDRSTYVKSGLSGVAISIQMRPAKPDSLLETWSTHVVRSDRLSPIAPAQPENTDFLELRVDFEESAALFTKLHNSCHWVVTLERHITRQQIEALEISPDILSIQEGVGNANNLTLIVSANSGKDLIVSRLTRKLERLIADKKYLISKGLTLRDISEKTYEETKKFAPKLALKAMGISRVTEEIIGLMVARAVSKLKFSSVFSNDGYGLFASISLDEHQNWFGGGGEVRADIFNIAFSLKNDNLRIDIEVVEGKLRQEFDPHGVHQVERTCKFFEDILKHRDRVDSELWREQFLSAIETADRSMVKTWGFENFNSSGEMPSSLRDKFREGQYDLGSITGVYSICIWDDVGREVARTRKGDIDVVRSCSTNIIPLILGDDLKIEGSIKSDNFNLPEDESNTVDEATITEENIVDDQAVLLAQLEQLIELSKVKGYLTYSEIKNILLNELPSSNSLKALVQLLERAGINVYEFPPNDEKPMIAENDNVSQKSEKKSKLDGSILVGMYQTILDCYAEQNISVKPAQEDEIPFIEGPASILFKILPLGSTDPKKLSDKSQLLKLKLKLEQDQEIGFSIDKGYVNIDVPKLSNQRYFVDAGEMWSSWIRPESELAAPLGEDRFGNTISVNFSNTLSPHFLVGGTTGSGKSEALNVLLYGLVKYYEASELQLLLVDPKGTELQDFLKTPHLMGDIGWDDQQALDLLKLAVVEMQRRYDRMRIEKCRSIVEYNSVVAPGDRFPWWVVVLDEYADLTSDPDMKKEIEAELKRLAQKARASGIHVVIATQKPSGEVISTNLRSNLPAQLALRVKSATESRVIMDESGAEMLNGKGDAYWKFGSAKLRIQCALVSKEDAQLVLSRFK